MKIDKSGIYIFIIISVALLNPSKIQAENPDSTSSNKNEKLILPFSNPVQGFDANLMAWQTTTKLLVNGGNWFGEKLELPNSKKGRLLHIAITAYLNNATSYYSHEIAHQLFNRKNRAFKVNFTDWYPQLVPEFEFWDDISDVWNDYELEQLIYAEETNPAIIYKCIRINEAGLYQEAFNVKHSVLNSYLERKLTFSNAISSILNGLSTQQYLLFHRDDPIGELDKAQVTLYHYNDITGYVHNMKELGIYISADDWFLWSAAAFLASGQTWNSGRAILSYLVSGKKSVNNISISLNERFAVSPANFYLFPTIRGLYMETEFFVLSKNENEGMLRIGVGTGLDSFGFRRTGPTDWLRIGGKYHSFQVDIPYSSLEVSPFCYFNFDRDFRHKGQSIGFDVRTSLWRRFYLYTKFEHDTNDMEEQLIKNKDEGLNILGALEIEI